MNKKYLIILSIIAILICSFIVALGAKDLEREGIKCVKNPLLWASIRMKETENVEYVCECHIKEDYVLDSGMNLSELFEISPLNGSD